MKAGQISSSVIWSPSGARPQKQYQRVTFNPLVKTRPGTQATAANVPASKIHSKNLNHTSSLTALLKNSGDKSSNERTSYATAENKFFAGIESQSEDLFDTLSSILQNNEDTDSNLSEDYTTVVSRESFLARGNRVRPDDSTNSSAELHTNWFNYLKFKSQKQEFKNSAKHVHCYPYIEISSSVKGKNKSNKDEDRDKTKEIAENLKSSKENKHLREGTIQAFNCGSMKNTRAAERLLDSDGKQKALNVSKSSDAKSTNPDAKYKLEIYKNQPLKIEEYEPGLKSSIFSSHKSKDHESSSLRWYESDADIRYGHDEGIFHEHWHDSGYLSSSGIPNGSERGRKQQTASFSRQTSLEHILAEEREAKVKKEIMENRARRHHDTFMPKEKHFLSDRYDHLLSLRSVTGSRVKGKARVMFSFKPQHENELALKKGDVVQLLRRVDANWYKGEINGKIGVFPSNYVDVIVSLEEAERLAHDKEGRAVVVFDFTGRSPLELSLKKGDELMLIRRVDNNWYEGRLKGRQGIFPSNYVEILRPPLSRPMTPTADGSNHVSRCSSSFSIGPDLPSPWNSDAYESEFEREYLVSPFKMPVQPFKDCNKSPLVVSLNNTIRRKESDSTATGSAPAQETFDCLRTGDWKVQSEEKSHHGVWSRTLKELEPRRVPNGKKFKVIDRCRALYNYLPQNDDELKLKEGDVIGIVEKCDDGWYIGFCEESKTFGTFPGNYVQIIG